MCRRNCYFSWRPMANSENGEREENSRRVRDSRVRSAPFGSTWTLSRHFEKPLTALHLLRALAIAVECATFFWTRCDWRASSEHLLEWCPLALLEESSNSSSYFYSSSSPNSSLVALERMAARLKKRYNLSRARKRVLAKTMTRQQ